MSTPIPAAVAAFCDALGLPPEATADVQDIAWGRPLHGARVTFSSCDAFRAACDALGVEPGKGPVLGGYRNPYRLFDEYTREKTLLVHHCWLLSSPCWEDAS